MCYNESTATPGGRSGWVLYPRHASVRGCQITTTSEHPRKHMPSRGAQHVAAHLWNLLACMPKLETLGFGYQLKHCLTLGVTPCEP